MTVDPFNGGSSATMFMSTGRDPEVEAIRLEVVKGRARVNTAGIALRLNASQEDLREVLEALGLVAPQVAVEPPEEPAVPRALKTNARPPTKRSERAKRSVLHRESHNPLLCGNQLHQMTGDNVRIGADGGKRCVPCAKASAKRKREARAQTTTVLDAGWFVKPWVRPDRISTHYRNQGALSWLCGGRPVLGGERQLVPVVKVHPTDRGVCKGCVAIRAEDIARAKTYQGKWCGSGEHKLDVDNVAENGECRECRNRRARLNRAKKKAA